jgi:hypothetical protein
MGLGGAVVTSVHTRAARRMPSENEPATCYTKEETANRSDPDTDARYDCDCAQLHHPILIGFAGKKNGSEILIII